MLLKRILNIRQKREIDVFTYVVGVLFGWLLYLVGFNSMSQIKLTYPTENKVSSMGD